MKFYKGVPWTIWGLLIYSLAPLIISMVGLSPQTALMLQLPALLAILLAILQSNNGGKRMYETPFMNFFFTVYMILCLIMYLRGYSLEERDATLNLNGKLYLALGGGQYILWALMPLFVLKSYPYFNIRPIVRTAFSICLVLSLFTLTQLPALMRSSLALALGNVGDTDVQFGYARIGETFAPLLMCLTYLTKKEKRVILFAYGVNILVVILMARRGALAMSSILCMFALLIELPKMKGAKRTGTIIIIALASLFAVYFLAGSAMFTYLSERGLEDTRAGVNEELLNQMSDWEKIVGKGLNGRYYMPMRQTDFYDGWRYGCETGFLNLVLKGGYIMAFVYIFLLIVPAFQGIFRSKNNFCKGGGFYILWTLIYLYPFGVLDFNISFFFVWMWVMLCSMPSVRNMTDDQILSEYFI